MIDGEPPKSRVVIQQCRIVSRNIRHTATQQRIPGSRTDAPKAAKFHYLRGRGRAAVATREGQAKRPQGLRIWGRLGVPDRAGGQERSGTPIKLKIRVLIRESGCPNLDAGLVIYNPAPKLS